MKKLSKIELDVVVNEVINNIKKIEGNKSKELFDKNENKDLFLRKVKEREELEDELELLNDEIRRYNNNESFSLSLLNGKGSEYGLYKEIEKDIILNGINSEFDIKKFIEELVEKFK